MEHLAFWATTISGSVVFILCFLELLGQRWSRLEWRQEIMENLKALKEADEALQREIQGTQANIESVAEELAKAKKKIRTLRTHTGLETKESVNKVAEEFFL